MHFRKYLFTLSFLASLTGCQTMPMLAPSPVAALHPPAAQRSAPRLGIQNRSEKPRFPQSWQGQWKGQCQALGLNNTQTFAPFEMRLTIQPRSPKTWQWKIEYINAQMHQNRDYELQEVDGSQGHFAIDEKNGIVLDTFKVNENLIFEQFSIGTSMIMGKHEWVDASTMKVELTTFSTQPIRQSGAEENTVHSFELRSFQTCTLKR